MARWMRAVLMVIALCSGAARADCGAQPETACTPWPLWEGAAPPAYEHVGLCLSP